MPDYGQDPAYYEPPLMSGNYDQRSGPPTPYPRNRGMTNHAEVPEYPIADPEPMSIEDQAKQFKDRQNKNAREMLARYDEEIARLQKVLEDYKAGADVLRSLIVNGDEETS